SLPQVGRELEATALGRREDGCLLGRRDPKSQDLVSHETVLGFWRSPCPQSRTSVARKSCSVFSPTHGRAPVPRAAPRPPRVVERGAASQGLALAVVRRQGGRVWPRRNPPAPGRRRRR